MTRKGRDLYLKAINVLVKEMGVSRCVYLIRRRVLIRDIKYFVKRLHPWDYEKKYPEAAKLFTALCYNTRDREEIPWGLRIMKNGRFLFGKNGKYSKNREKVYIDCLEERPGEWIKRFNTVLDLSNTNYEVLDTIFTYLEKNDFNEKELQELKLKSKKKMGLVHEESIEMMINAFLMKKKKGAN